MLQISLVNPPFADVSFPALALMQLKSVTERVCGSEVSIRVLNVNNDFALELGVSAYKDIACSLDSNMIGLGDWYFSQAAFPERTDNTTAYFNRFLRDKAATAATRRNREVMLAKRPHVTSFIASVVDKYGLADDDVVGFTSMFCQNVASLAFARELKQRPHPPLVVMGGANCDAPMGRTLLTAVPYIDYVFSGPALKSFPEFIKLLCAGQTDACGRIAGVTSRANVTPSASAATVADQQPAAVIGESLPIDADVPLDHGPFLDALEELFGADTVTPTLLLETSRGCWWGERAHCTFCGLNGLTMAFQAMAPSRAIAQFESLFKYANRCAHIMSVDNILPREYLTDVLPKLRTPENMDIFYEVKADLTLAELRTLADARVKVIQPGIEALATSTLKLMKKGTSSFTNIAFLKNCRALGIVPHWNLLVGFPGEQEHVYRKYVSDAPLLTHLQPPSGVFPVRFDRFSPYFNKATEYGLRLHASEWYGYIYPFAPSVLDGLAYYFTNVNFDAPYLHAVARHLPKMRAAVEQWRRLWWPGSPRPELTLSRDASGIVIKDSRSGGNPREYRLTAAQHELLRLTERQRQIPDLVQHGGPQAAEALAWCQERGLLFEEDGRVVSLVIDSETAQQSAAAGSEVARVAGGSRASRVHVFN